jgi:tetratricopeptide (TPR) repeat protein
MIRSLRLASWLLAAAACAGMGFMAAGPARAAVPEKLAAGDAAVARFEVDAAVTAYRAARTLAPDNYEAAWKLSRALADKATLTTDRAQEKKLVVEAESVAREAVRLKPDDAKGHVFLAIAVGKLALYEGGKRQVELSREVKSAAQRALELDADEDLAHHVLGVWNREMSELNWALKQFAQLLYGRFPPASLEEAAGHLRQAAGLAPETVSHQVELGITLASSRQWAAAKEALEKAIAMSPSWVTDDHYKALAKQHLDRVKARMK